MKPVPPPGQKIQGVYLPGRRAFCSGLWPRLLVPSHLTPDLSPLSAPSLRHTGNTGYRDEEDFGFS